MDKQSEDQIKYILLDYQSKFSSKIYSQDNKDYDLLMDAFGISPKLKLENKQYWGRELGACLEKIMKTRMSKNIHYEEPIKEKSGREPYDFQFKDRAVDVKYRIGSGDAGTIKKWTENAKDIIELGLNPTLLILREDNLESTISACRRAGWDIFIGEEFYEFSKKEMDFNLKKYLKSIKSEYQIKR